jgi:hypothetical protein
MFSMKRVFFVVLLFLVIISSIGADKASAQTVWELYRGYELICRVDISPTQLNFGDIIANTTQKATFNISCQTFNTSGGHFVCYVNFLTTDATPFTTEAPDWDHRYFTSYNVPVYFSPTTIGSFNKKIYIGFDVYFKADDVGQSHWGSSQSEITVTGNGVPPPHPFTLESFENGFGNWTAGAGTPTSAVTYKHAGSYSYTVNEDQEYIYNTQGSNLNKVAMVYFYDNKDTNMRVFASVDNGISDIGIGVDLYNNYYSYKIGGTFTTTSIPRSTGWHQFVWDYTSGTGVVLKIDGTQIAASSAVTSFKRIWLGDKWTDGYTANAYFDDVKIQDSLAVFSKDGFESGFGNWINMNGSPSTSSVNKHTGVYSYVFDQDQDRIWLNMDANLQKVATVWFYDDPTKTNIKVFASVDDNLKEVAIGVDLSQSFYSYKIGPVFTTTSIPRTLGWHQFVWDYTSGTGLVLKIDGLDIASDTTVTSFNRIVLGDRWADGFIATGVYFDDVTVRDSLPAVFSKDGFENGFGKWAYLNGTPSSGTVSKHTGNNSYVLDEDLDRIALYTGINLQKVASIWFYDDPTKTAIKVFAMVDNNLKEIGIGVDLSQNVYSYKIGTVFTPTGITRTSGWHQFVWDYTSGTGVVLKIDGVDIATDSTVTFFNRIMLGDKWGEGNIATGVCFDDVAIQDSLPVLFTTDSFESGFDSWAYMNGTPSSASVSHTGNYSYTFNEDRDRIALFLGMNLQKVLSVWFFDDPGKTSLKVFGLVDDRIKNIGIGVNQSQSVYSYMVGSTITNTSISRTPGWHQFVWDYSSGSGVVLKIDGIEIATDSTVTTFNRVSLGDNWADGLTAVGVYFDDVAIQDM